MPRFRNLLISLLGAGLIALAGCTPSGPSSTGGLGGQGIEGITATSPQAPSIGMPEPRPIDRAGASAPIDPVFLTAYLEIGELHIDRPDFAELTMAGFEGFKSIDAGLQVTPGEDSVTFAGPNGESRTLPLPPSNQANLWALAATAGMLAAREVSPALASAEGTDLYEAYFDASTETLDEYSRYLTEEEARGERAFRVGYGGVGIVIDTAEEGGAVVVDVFADGPAENAGVEIGWRITAVDGASVVSMEIGGIADRLRGRPGTSVAIDFRDGATPRPLTLRREQVTPNVVRGRLEPGGIGVIELSGFNVTATENMEAEIARLQSEAGGRLNGLILDVRGNPGGILGVAKDIADLFLTGGRIVFTRGRNPASQRDYDADASAVVGDTPIAVLIDGRSASAAEILAGALQDRGRAVVVGATSYGKGSVQTIVELPNQGQLFLTWSRYFVPSGITIDQQGIVPTICTSIDADSAAEVISAFRAGSLPSPAELEPLRRRAPDDQAALNRIRAVCEWEPREAEFDVDVAIEFLSNQDLYLQALRAQEVTLAAR